LLRHDRKWLLAMEEDPEVMRFLDGGRSRPAPAPDGDDGFLRPRGPMPGVWGIVERSTSAFVGWVSLRNSAGKPDVYELGYRLLRAYWGRGYATEASRAAIGIIGRATDPVTITARTMAVNTRSRRVLEKAGLSHVATVVEQWADPLPGSELGEAIYELRISPTIRSQPR